MQTQLMLFHLAVLTTMALFGIYTNKSCVASLCTLYFGPYIPKDIFFLKIIFQQ